MNDDHGPLDHSGVVFGVAFVVADGASATVDPRQGLLGDPSAVQDLEADLVGELAHDLHREAQDSGGPR
ncbi:hypothetical protein [Micromonospora sp. NPDC047730]|uniref:hypothetical protein n=1 Tax=Micromonospora sp. NPDC047730 TaxID=3364253 RepID=UPI00371EA3AE